MAVTARRGSIQDAHRSADALNSSERKPGKKDDTHHKQIGKLVGEGHVNYVLMYNMLTGIRVAVGP